MDDLFDEPAEQNTVAETVVDEQATQETGAEETQAAAETTEEKPVDKTQTVDWEAKVRGLEAAAAADRRKRQEAERKLAEKEQEEKPYLGEEYEQRFAETRTEFQQQLLNQKLDISEAFAREKYSDFDDKLTIFSSLCQENPTLYEQMAAQANPAEFVYRTASNQQKLKEMGDPTEYENKIRADERARVAAEYEKKMAEEGKKRADLPGSIATVSAAGGATSATWSGPTSLDDLLK